MNDLFRNQYRISSIRLKNWDYTSPAFYFVTICTKNRTCYFGQIQNENIILNDAGKIIQQQLLNIPKIKQHIQMDEYVIMPNHMHFILNINPIYNIECRDVPVARLSLNSMTSNITNTPKFETPQSETPQKGVSTTWQSNCLGSIINQFKGKCTKLIKPINPEFSWQTRFYEHIINSDKDLENVRNYIICNPSNWQNDKNKPSV